MTDEVKDVNRIVDMIVETFEIYGVHNETVPDDLLLTIREIILSHGRMMKTKGMIEANENTGKLIKGVFGNG